MSKVAYLELSHFARIQVEFSDGSTKPWRKRTVRKLFLLILLELSKFQLSCRFILTKFLQNKYHILEKKIVHFFMIFFIFLKFAIFNQNYQPIHRADVISILLHVALFPSNENCMLHNKLIFNLLYFKT